MHISVSAMNEAEIAGINSIPHSVFADHYKVSIFMYHCLLSLQCTILRQLKPRFLVVQREYPSLSSSFMSSTTSAVGRRRNNASWNPAQSLRVSTADSILSFDKSLCALMIVPIPPVQPNA